MQVIGSLGYPITVYGLKTIDPYTFAFFRFVLCAVVVMTGQLIWGEKTPPIEKKDWPRIVLLGILIIPMNQLLFLVGQSMTAAGHSAVLFSTMPLWILIFSVIILKEKLMIRQIVGTIAAIAGVIVIVTGGAITLGKSYLLGDLIVVGSVFAWVFYTILGKSLVRKYGPFRMTAYTLAIGTLFYLPYGFYHVLHADYSQATTGAWLTVVYMALAMSIVGYSLWYWALKYTDAAKLGLYYNVQPIIATSVAFLVLHEPIGLPFVIGSLIVLAGVLTAELSVIKPK